MIPHSDIEIFITAGGRSSRMGQDKGLMMIAEKPMLVHLTDMLLINNLSFTVIANSQAYQQFGFKVVSDVIPDKGPIGALHTSFHYAQKDFVLLLGCDTPFFSIEAITRLMNEAKCGSVSVAKIMTKIDPLHAVYPVSLKRKVETCIENNQLKMQELILQFEYQVVEMNDLRVKCPEGFINMNEPNDVMKWELEQQMLK